MNYTQEKIVGNLLNKAKDKIITEGKATFEKSADGKAIAKLKKKREACEQTIEKVNREIEALGSCYETAYCGWHSGGRVYILPETNERLKALDDMVEELKTQLAFAGRKQSEVFMAFVKKLEAM